MQEGCIIHTTAEVALTELYGLRFKRSFDPDTEIHADGRPLVVTANAPGRWSVFDFEACMRWWQEYGTHPLNNDCRLQLTDFFQWTP